MSVDRRELDDLLAVVVDFADKALVDAAEVDLTLVASTPLPTLVADLTEAEVPDALAWAFEVVEAVAARDASWGFVLASRYAAEFALAGAPNASPGCFLSSGQRTEGGVLVPAAPLAAGPLDALLVVTEEGIRRLEGATPDAQQPHRTGLAGARLTAVTARSDAAVEGADAAAWPVLLGAAVSGLGNALSRESVRYTEQREQFGAPIASFPGLRAVVGTAYADLRRARALLYAHAQGTPATPVADTLALAADTVVNSAIDAVQSMGGYGYIDEFPVAGMFRDAISLRARASSALSGWRSGAELAYALEGQGT
jgi:hypothetical protein